MPKKVFLSMGLIVWLLALGLPSGNAQQTVIGQDNPAVDLPAVQAAVSQGGEILLKGTFDFGNEGRVTITKDVKIRGEADPVTKIKGGFWTFYSPLPAKLPPEVPGPKIIIQAIHFDGALWSPICLAYSSGSTIAHNTITRVRPKALAGQLLFGKPGLNMQAGIICNPGYAQTWETQKYIPKAFTGMLIIEDNTIDLINEDLAKTWGEGLLILWTTGIRAEIRGNTIHNCSRNSIELSDNFIGEEGSGRIHIEDNKIQTPPVGLPVPSPETPNGIAAGWFLDPTGGPDPKRNQKYIIEKNSIRAGGQSSLGLGIFSDEVLLMNNVVATEAPGAIPLLLAGSNGRIVQNQIEGRGTCGIMARPMGPLKASHNLFLGNDFTQFKASVADFNFLKGANNNHVLGSKGTVTDLGSGNQTIGLTAVSQ